MDPTRDRPIRSSLADDPASASTIDAFVIALGERVDAMQDCEAAGQLGQLEGLAGALAADATKAGYPALASCAGGVQRACNEGSGDLARKGVEELTELARRVRLGHRGAA